MDTSGGLKSEAIRRQPIGFMEDFIMAVDGTYQPKVYKKSGGDEMVVASGGIITLQSGASLVAESGSTLDLPDISVAVGDLALTTGSLIIGVAGKATAIDAKADGKILIGNGTTAAMQSLGTDVTMSNAGAVTIANNAITAVKINADAVTTAKILDGNVTAAKLANNAAGLNSVGMGASASYAKTTNGVQTLATGTAGAKTCLFIVSVTTTFVTNGGGNEQPTFKFGQVGTDDKFSVAALLTDATAGQIKVFPGSLTASTNVICTATAAAGTGDGAIAVSVIILPTAS
jgi:hypothetical protein